MILNIFVLDAPQATSAKKQEFLIVNSFRSMNLKIILVLDTTTGLIIGSNRMKMDMGHVREATLFVAVISTDTIRTSVVTALEDFVLTTPIAALALIKD